MSSLGGFAGIRTWASTAPPRPQSSGGIIPGIGRLAAEIVIAETGGDMTQFASAHRLASCIGVCPGQYESDGGDSYLGVFFRRLAARRGGKRALVAVMHKLAIAIWHVLHDKARYRELGADHFTRRDPERAMRRMIKEANSLGLTIRFEPITA